MRFKTSMRTPAFAPSRLVARLVGATFTSPLGGRHLFFAPPFSSPCPSEAKLPARAFRARPCGRSALAKRHCVSSNSDVGFAATIDGSLVDENCNSFEHWNHQCA